jgi:hypothetical protein
VPLVPPAGADPPEEFWAPASSLNPAAAPLSCMPSPAEPVCLPADPTEPASDWPPLLLPLESGSALSSG